MACRGSLQRFFKSVFYERWIIYEPEEGQALLGVEGTRFRQTYNSCVAAPRPAD